MTLNQTLISVRGLKTHFFTDEGVVKAVDGVDFDIPRGKTLCVVGESGSGKSVTARSIMQLIDRPGKIVAGEVLYYREEGKPIDIVQLGNTGKDIRSIRGNDISLIFQEPMTALSPIHTIGNQVTEAILLHQAITKEEATERAIQMLARVGIPKPKERMTSYPFELSGGMRQRVCIAMALVCEPVLLIADEPTTALDVTTQANILDLIFDLQQEMGMSVMFITHDLGVVAEIADEVVVMYLGQVVEQSDVDTIFHNPKHPYTQALLKSIPKLDLEERHRLEQIRGMVPHPFNRPSGCSFHTRCEQIMRGTCERITPQYLELEPGHSVRCLLYQDEAKEVNA
ncbi:MAG: ABC transporter ATP-binding protein [Trueperaceae bacterium]|nr:ABC transporter ATP-binding protein [Trueperaceae bacterium]